MSLSSEVQKLISSEQQREVMPVATESKRITFTVTPDMVPLMDRAKRMFYDRTQSDMIRILIVAGLESQNSKEHSDGSKKHFTKRLPDLLGEETAKTF
jgi:hypothetical protein